MAQAFASGLAIIGNGDSEQILVTYGVQNAASRALAMPRKTIDELFGCRQTGCQPLIENGIHGLAGDGGTCLANPPSCHGENDERLETLLSSLGTSCAHGKK